MMLASIAEARTDGAARGERSSLQLSRVATEEGDSQRGKPRSSSARLLPKGRKKVKPVATPPQTPILRPLSSTFSAEQLLKQHHLLNTLRVLVNLRFSSFSLGIAQAAGLALLSLVRRFLTSPFVVINVTITCLSVPVSRLRADTRRSISSSSLADIE